MILFCLSLFELDLYHLQLQEDIVIADRYNDLYWGYFIYKARDWNKCSMTSLSEIKVYIYNHTDFVAEST